MLLNSTLAMWRKYKTFSISFLEFVAHLHTDCVAQVQDVKYLNLNLFCLISTLTVWRKYEMFSISILDFDANLHIGYVAQVWNV